MTAKGPNIKLDNDYKLAQYIEGDLVVGKEGKRNIKANSKRNLKQ